MTLELTAGVFSSALSSPLDTIGAAPPFFFVGLEAAFVFTIDFLAGDLALPCFTGDLERDLSDFASSSSGNETFLLVGDLTLLCFAGDIECERSFCDSSSSSFTGIDDWRSAGVLRCTGAFSGAVFFFTGERLGAMAEKRRLAQDRNGAKSCQ